MPIATDGNTLHVPLAEIIRNPVENRQSSGVADENAQNGGAEFFVDAQMEREERAAILQYDGRKSRTDAERLASDELPAFLDRRGKH